MILAPSTNPLRILLLGGTTEAAALGRRLASSNNIVATLSLAGRTADPAASALAVRLGGFGGIDGLKDYLRRQKIDLLVDATHPFATRISANAVAACAITSTNLLAIERPQWTRLARDDWAEHETIDAAIAALPDEPQDVFSALGRQAINALCSAPRHRYLIRVVDDLELPSDLTNAKLVVSRGPFRAEDDAKLFEDHGIRFVLAKNAGGSATYSKIEAARKLGIKVHMVRRPALPPRTAVATADEALTWIVAHHQACSDLGV
jgi:precorrin-6A/cobalt-precorrin-6A reductase